MSWEILLTLVVLIGVIAGLIVLRTGPDIVLLGGLGILLLSGILTPAQAFSGFGNEGLITVALLYIVAEGLQQTGAINFVGQQLLGRPKSVTSAQARVVLPTAIASAFLNNTPVVAVLLPMINEWAKKNRISVSWFLLPLSYAAILGGLCTLIGTSTTLVVNGLLIDAGYPSLGMFEISAVGVPAAVLGLLFILCCSRRLLKERKPAKELLEDPREYSVEMLVEENCPLVGKTIEEAGLRHLSDMYLVEIVRQDRVLAAVAPSERIQANDRLVFVGIADSVAELQKIPGLRPATDQVFKLDSPRSERCLIEAVVSSHCPILYMTVREGEFRTRYNAAIIAVARSGKRIRKKIGDIVLQPGDTLLLEAHPSFIQTQRHSKDFFLISEVANSRPPRHERAWIARGILAGMILVASLGLLSMLKAALIAAAAMVVTRCCRMSEARRAVDLSVLIVIATGLGIGKAVEVSGTARFLADHAVAAIGAKPWLVLIFVYLITMVLTNLITAKAAAVLVFPIAMAAVQSLSTQMGVSVNYLPFAIAVIMAAAAGFVTPIAYQTNLMVMGPGGYRTEDFLRLGIPLSLIVALVTLTLAPIVWPFYS